MVDVAYFDSSFETEERAERDRNRRATFLGRVSLCLVIVTCLFLLASQTTGLVAAFGIGGLIFAMAAALGGVIGFLFSVPRILARDPLAPLPGSEADKEESFRGGSRQGPVPSFEFEP